MSDDVVQTTILTEEKPLACQHYFVRDRCEPKVTGFDFRGIEAAKPSSALISLLESGGLEAIIICPSNPFVSVGPILALEGLEQKLKDSGSPIIAVSPIIGGQAIKGPAAKMMKELGVPVSALGIAKLYRDRINGLVIDDQDKDQRSDIEALGLEVLVTKTFMQTLQDRIDLAAQTLAFSKSLRSAK